MSNHEILDGQHAVITGGGRGIGAAISSELAHLGATLTLMGRNLTTLNQKCKELQEISHRPPFAVSVDVTKPDQVKKAFDTGRKKYGDPSILINNAGAVETAPFVESDAELWRRMIEINLLSTVSCIHEALPAMVKNKNGRIVNVASHAGLVGYRFVSAYCAAKHGLVGLTRSLSLEVLNQGVTVNAVCPGYTDTDLLRESITRVAQKSGKSVSEIREKFGQANPQRRLIQPNEVARKVAWLCLPEQQSITGQAIEMDGGENARS